MITWIASYPKSGNTWVRSLISTYLYGEDGIFNFDLLKRIEQFPNKRNLEFFFKDISNLTLNKVSEYWIPAQERMNLVNDNIFLKTHSALCSVENNAFTNKSNTQAVIYIVRDPRNVITSLSNHFSMNLEEAYSFMINTKQLLLNEQLGKYATLSNTVLGSWADHYNSWNNPKLSPILFIKYEDLIKNTQETLIKILTFLSKFMDIEINNEKIKTTVNSCSFSTLSKKEKEEGFPEAAYAKKNKKKVNFFNLGEKNNWKDLLSKDIEVKISNFFEKEMKEHNYL